MSLLLAPIGQEMHVKQCLMDESLKKHLEDLGFIAGSSVILVKENRGNIIVQIKESRIALNKELARLILVS